MANIRKVADAVVQLEIWVAVFAVGSSMLVIDWLPWAVVLLGSMWVLRLIARGKLSVATPVDAPVMLLVVIIPLNYWLSPIPEKSLPQLWRLLLGIGFLYALVNWTVEGIASKWGEASKRLIGLVWGTFLLTCGLIGFSLISVNWVSDKLVFIPEKIYSFVSVSVADAVHPNVMAGILVIFLPVLTGFLLFVRGDMPIGQKALIFFVNLCGMAVLVLTQSRGALISYALVLVGMFCLRFRWGWVGLGGAGLVLGWKIAQIGVGQFLDAVLVGATLGGMGGREQIWRRAWYMIQDFPLTGVGMGLFGDVADALYPFADFAAGRIPHAHQLFLQVAVDLGIPGFIAWVTILGIVCASAWQLYRKGLKNKNGWLAGLGVGLFGSQMALCLHGLLDAVTWGMVRPAPFVWGIWGLTLAAWIVHEKL